MFGQFNALDSMHMLRVCGPAPTPTSSGRVSPDHLYTPKAPVQCEARSLRRQCPEWPVGRDGTGRLDGWARTGGTGVGCRFSSSPSSVNPLRLLVEKNGGTARPYPSCPPSTLTSRRPTQERRATQPLLRKPREKGGESLPKSRRPRPTSSCPGPDVLRPS